MNSFNAALIGAGHCYDAVLRAMTAAIGIWPAIGMFVACVLIGRFLLFQIKAAIKFVLSLPHRAVYALCDHNGLGDVYLKFSLTEDEYYALKLRQSRPSTPRLGRPTPLVWNVAVALARLIWRSLCYCCGVLGLIYTRTVDLVSALRSATHFCVQGARRFPEIATAAHFCVRRAILPVINDDAKSASVRVSPTLVERFLPACTSLFSSLGMMLADGRFVGGLDVYMDATVSPLWDDLLYPDHVSASESLDAATSESSDAATSESSDAATSESSDAVTPESSDRDEEEGDEAWEDTTPSLSGSIFSAMSEEFETQSDNSRILSGLDYFSSTSGSLAHSTVTKSVEELKSSEAAPCQARGHENENFESRGSVVGASPAPVLGFDAMRSDSPEPIALAGPSSPATLPESSLPIRYWFYDAISLSPADFERSAEGGSPGKGKSRRRSSGRRGALWGGKGKAATEVLDGARLADGIGCPGPLVMWDPAQGVEREHSKDKKSQRVFKRVKKLVTMR